MTDNSEREFLATQVMGWVMYGGLTEDSPDKFWYEKGKVPPQYPVMRVKDFDPRNNIEQAFGLLDTFEQGYSITKNVYADESVDFDLMIEDFMFTGIRTKRIESAIVFAVLLAYNWKGE